MIKERAVKAYENFNLVDVKSLKKLESGYGCRGKIEIQGRKILKINLRLILIVDLNYQIFSLSLT